MSSKEGDDTFGKAIDMKSRRLRNPAILVFMLLFMTIYALLFIMLDSKEPIDLLELARALPFAISALVLGFFSVLFWALNYVGRNQKSELRCIEAERLFEIRRRAIERVFSESDSVAPSDLTILKAHLLMANGEFDWEPETPATSMAFDYGEAIKAILRRS